MERKREGESLFRITTNWDQLVAMKIREEESLLVADVVSSYLTPSFI